MATIPIRATVDTVVGPMVEWSARYESMTQDERFDLEREAAALAVQAARLAGYLTRRIVGGSHESAVTRQNDTARGVRRVLGYSYPHAPITF